MEKNNENEDFNINNRRDMLHDMLRTEELCYEYNNIPASDIEKRNELLKKLFKRADGDFLIFSPFKCALGYNIELGNMVAINSYCCILDGGEVKFGDDVWVGPNCEFISSGHSVNPKRRKAGYGYANPIVIEDNVYIGSRVTVVCPEHRGITIGENSVIGSGSVVTKDIPANVLAAGNPCKVIRSLPEKEE
ncbi:MAG: sugar O-acetyltransferase [Ruminococcus sp.]|jgi:acetyltransferase-like isoleucine patch superfamily enzyme|nr:sugar O-acetyltransferase [Ruminococcus sp.]